MRKKPLESPPNSSHHHCLAGVGVSAALGLVLSLLLGPAVFCTTSPVKILAMGTVLPTDTPLIGWARDEPLIEITPIPTRIGGVSFEAEEARRMIRMYFPRRLTPKTYQVLVFSGGDVVHFTTSQISQMIAGVESGMGAIADCGGTSAISQFAASWVASGIDRIFPNDVASVLQEKYSFSVGNYPGYFLMRIPYTIRVTDAPNNPLSPFVPLGLERWHGYAGRRMVQRPGSTVLAVMDGEFGFLKQNPPFILEWNFGRGSTMTVSEWFGHPFWSDRSSQIHLRDNLYPEEEFVNIILSVSKREIFSDILTIHKVKEKFEAFANARSDLIAFLDFLSMFGANTIQIEANIHSADHLRSEAEDAYLDGRYEESLDKVDSAFETVRLAFRDALRLKRSTLLYIYLIEWAAVTGTMSVAAGALWQLMIRRGKFKRVGTTRAS